MLKKTRNWQAMAMIALLAGLLVMPISDALADDVDDTPVWNITENSSAKSVKWVSHKPNSRFSIYDPNQDSDTSKDSTLRDDLILDRETGLMWPRDANLAVNYPAEAIDPPPHPDGLYDWNSAKWFYRRIILGNRIAFRLPTIEELSSLVDPSQSTPALPFGHPFINVPTDGIGWWSSTTYDESSAYAYFLLPSIGVVGTLPKSERKYLWPVRGGNGYATGRW